MIPRIQSPLPGWPRDITEKVFIMPKKPKNKPLREEYAEICNEYLRRFCKKHGFYLSDADWVGDDAGGLAQIADYFFSFEDIRYDVDNEVPEDVIIEWYDYDLEVRSLEIDYLMAKNLRTFVKINYPSWCKGAPKPYTPQELAKMRDEITKMIQASKKLRNFVQNNIKSVKK